MRARMRELLLRPSHGASLARVTQALEPSAMPGQREDDELDLDSDTDMIPSRVLETGPADLLE